MSFIGALCNIKGEKEVVMKTKNDLHSACFNEDIQLVKQFLIDIKPTVLNKKLTDYSSAINGTPLHIACEKENIEIIKLLVEAGADLEIKNVGRETALSIVVKKNNIKLTNYLIEQDADINAKGANGMLPIHFACAYGGKEVINLLLSKGADINVLDSLKSSLLDYTTNLRGGNIEATTTLIENGINTDYYAKAFKEACWRNNLEIAKLLLDKGVDYKSQTTAKSELLFWICTLGHLEIVELLLGLGVDFKIKVKFKGKMNSYNGSPLDKAKEVGNIKIVEIIEKNNIA